MWFALYFVRVSVDFIIVLCITIYYQAVCDFCVFFSVLTSGHCELVKTRLTHLIFSYLLYLGTILLHKLFLRY